MNNDLVNRLREQAKYWRAPPLTACRTAELLEQAADALAAGGDEKPFAWYDHFNDELYRSKTYAERAASGGNKVTPLYARPITPAPASGYVLVPVEPTNDMLNAMLINDTVKLTDSGVALSATRTREGCIAAWQAALAAAPAIAAKETPK